MKAIITFILFAVLESSSVVLTAQSAATKRSEKSAVNKERQLISSYPNPRPGSKALRFLPGIVSTDSLDFNAAFSPDGKTFYFSRKQKGKNSIYQTTFVDSNWTTLALAPFSHPDCSEADPFVAKDGSVFYISDRPKVNDKNLRDQDIWVVHPTKDGAFSSPENIEVVNTDSSEFYVSIAGNGNLYFSSDRAGGRGQLDIYLSRYINGKYNTPENLSLAINGTTDEHDPYISEDERFIIFTSDRKGSIGVGDLYIAKRKANGAWQPAKNMGPTINTKTYEYCPNFSPDKKYFFFTSERDVKWIEARTVVGSQR